MDISLQTVINSAYRYGEKFKGYSKEYIEAVVYAKFGGLIGIEECSKVAEQYGK